MTDADRGDDEPGGDAPDDDDLTPAAPALVPTYPAAPALPPGVAITRTTAPAAPPADLGPFRTAGAAFVDRRGDTLVIRTRPPRAVIPVAATVVALGLGLLIVNGTLVAAALLAMAAAIGAVMLRDAAWMRTNRIEVTATHVIARAGGSPAIERRPRAAITRLTCAPVRLLDTATRVGRITYRHRDLQDGVRWGVFSLDDDGRRTRLADVGNRDDATAIAALLAHELGLPTWVPDDD